MVGDGEAAAAGLEDEETADVLAIVSSLSRLTFWLSTAASYQLKLNSSSAAYCPSFCRTLSVLSSS